MFGAARALQRLVSAPHIAPRLAPGMAPKRKAAAAAADGEGGGGGGGAPPPPPGAKKARAPAKPKVPPPPAGPVFSAAMRPPPLPPSAGGTRVLSFNVAGLRAFLKKEPQTLPRLVAAEVVDVLCLQEHKLQPEHCADVGAALAAALPGWHVTWACSTAKKGYSGVATLCRAPPLRAAEGLGPAGGDGEAEGRVLTTEHRSFFLVNAYVPNSGAELKRLDYRVRDGGWDAALAAHVRALEAGACALPALAGAPAKPVVLVGDLNCAHQAIDIHSPKTNLRSAGFTQEERDSLSRRLLGRAGDGEGAGMVDAFRAQYPGVAGYTYWSHRGGGRAANKGWRLDYALVSGALAGRVHECFHAPDVMGSDHCPVGLVLRDA